MSAAAAVKREKDLVNQRHGSNTRETGGLKQFVSRTMISIIIIVWVHLIDMRKHYLLLCLCLDRVVLRS